MDGNLLAVLGILLVLILLFTGANIGLSLLGVGFVGYVIIRGFTPAFSILRTAFTTSVTSYTYIVIPLFILMGNFAWKSGISDDMFNATKTWFGRTKGGIAYAAIIVCALFGAICGSMQAATATMCNVGKPIMKANHYKDEMIGGTLAVGPTLGLLIPPSNLLIIYGIIAEESIGDLFAAGIVPGILMTILFCINIFIWIKIDPNVAPAGSRFTMKEKLKSLVGYIPMLLLFVIVLGGMFSGILSLVEAAAAGAFISFIFMVIRRKASWKNIKECLSQTATATGMTLIAIGGATMFGAFLTLTKMPMNLANWTASLVLPPALIMAVIIVLFAVMGCFIDNLVLIILTVPIFLPIVQSMGYNAIWFGILMIIVSNLGVITPPLGLNCYIAGAQLGDVPLEKVFKGAVIYIPSFIVTFVLIVVFPQLISLL